MSDKKEARTIQVKIGSQSSREMTPDQAAEYLKCMAQASSSNPLRTDRVAFSFGSRSGGGSSSGGSSSTSSNNNNEKSTSFWKISAEAKEIAASSINAAVTRASQSVRNNATTASSSGTASGGSNSSIPCTEKEMKALMSMFVEIMGLQMNTEKLNSVSKKHGRKNLFRFPDDVPPPPGGWPADLTWPSPKDLEEHVSEDEDDIPDDDSLPDLEAIPVGDRKKKHEIETCDITKRSNKADDAEGLTTYSQLPVGYVAGIAVPEWEALERVAMEDALEQEERARKAAQAVSAVGKKAKRQSQRLNIPTPTVLTETADKHRRWELERQRHQKALAQWRQKVISVCQSNDIEAMNIVLEQSPVSSHTGKSDGGEDFVDPTFQRCLMDLAAQCLPKNRQSLEKGREARSILLQYVLKSPAPQVALTPQRNGRSVLHTACFYGDIQFVKIILESVSAFDNLAKTCEESGFTPLHYASLSGSSMTVQLLAKKGGINMKEKGTNDTHTWDSLSGKGLSVTQLLRNILRQASGKKSGMETHGMAIAEIQKDMMATKGTAGRFLQWLEKVAAHLEDDSIQSLTVEQTKAIDNLLVEEEATKSVADDMSVNRSEKSDSASTAPTNPNKKKKKKKKKGKQGENQEGLEKISVENLKPAPEVTPPLISNDPLVELLKGMGFKERPVIEGIQACGGPDRATADLVIAWMLERNEVEGSETPDGPFEDTTGVSPAETSMVLKPAPIEISANTKARVQVEDEQNDDEERLHAERLAAKREERRQRNREWNKKQEAQRSVPPPAPTTFPKQQPAPAQPGPASLSGRTVEFSVDTSTVVSSVGDYAKDDDLTVSTIGSRTTTTQTQPPPMPPPIASSPSPAYSSSAMHQQHTPPGFNSLAGVGGMVSASEPLKTSEPWQSAVQLPQYQASTIPAAATASSAPIPPPGLTQHLYSGLPPGIPETHPVVDERIRDPFMGTSIGGSAHGGGTAPALRNGGAVLAGHAPSPITNSSTILTGSGGSLGGYPHSHMSTPHERFAMPGMLHQNTDSYNSYQMRETAYPNGEINGSGYPGGESLFRQSHPDSAYLGSTTSGPQGGRLPQLSSTTFGISPPGVESSVIESISTGTSDIGGSSLWSSSNVLSGGGHEVSSSFLSHLIGDSKDKGSDSLFGQGQTDDDARRNSHSICNATEKFPRSPLGEGSQTRYLNTSISDGEASRYHRLGLENRERSPPYSRSYFSG